MEVARTSFSLWICLKNSTAKCLHGRNLKSSLEDLYCLDRRTSLKEESNKIHLQFQSVDDSNGTEILFSLPGCVYWFICWKPLLGHSLRQDWKEKGK